MTTHRPRALTLAPTTIDPHTVRVVVGGDLDFDTAPDFIALVHGQLAAHPDVRDLHLDLAGLGACDSTGLSALLTARRSAAAVSARLHLDRRPERLERFLDITGTLSYLTSWATETASADSGGGTGGRHGGRGETS